MLPPQKKCDPMIDTHTHIYESAYDADRAEMIGRAEAAGIERMLLPSCTPQDMHFVTATCQQFPQQCYPLYGLHPTEMGPNPMAEAEEIMAYAEKQERFTGVGEIGLDLHWDKSRAQEQSDVFLWQMRYAYDHNKPVSIHCREAVWLLLELLPKLGDRIPPSSLHCWAGSAEEAQLIARRYPMMMFGFGGSSTYKNSKVADIAALLPKDRLLTETDAPYLTPVPHRGERNEPAYIPLVVNRLAQSLGMPPSEVAQLTHRNAMHLFFPDEA